jgi:hypothetical protein
MNAEPETLIDGYLETRDGLPALSKLERLFSTVTRKNCAECGNEFDALGLVVVCPACEMLPAKRESEALPLPPCWPRRHVSRLGQMVGPSLAMAEKLAPKLVGGRLCVLAGQRGTGKTQIAVYAANWRASNGYSPGVYTRAFDMCASVVGFDREAKLERLQKAPFLVIDEAHRVEAKDLPLMESVMDDRYSNDRTTLCIGNWITHEGLHLGETVDGEKLTGIGSSLFSRVQEHQRDRTGGVVWCKWQSYRAKAPYDS